jgi:ElaA protein
VLRFARFADLTPFELYGLLRLRVDVFVVEQDCPYPELDGRDTEPGNRACVAQPRRRGGLLPARA